jgi:hypothetical protein
MAELPHHVAHQLGLPRVFARHHRRLPLAWLAYVLQGALIGVVGLIYLVTGELPWIGLAFVVAGLLGLLWQPLFFRNMAMDIDCGLDALVVHRLRLPYDRIDWAALRMSGCKAPRL